MLEWLLIQHFNTDITKLDEEREREKERNQQHPMHKQRTRHESIIRKLEVRQAAL
jgi:hypothetical protein